MVAASAVVAVALGACSSASTALDSRAASVQSKKTDVKFNNCADKCHGTIDGAKYAITLPSKWNGTLLMYSHGYRFAQPGPPDFGAVETNPQVSSLDSDGTGADAVSKQLLAKGYALAGSSYKSNGWAVADGVAADEKLHDAFLKLVGKPKRTYVWGDSLGGLITEIVAEKHPEWVDGAAPMCGAVAGPKLNLDLALDVAFAIKTLVDPSLKLTGYTSDAEANDAWKRAAALLVSTAKDTAGGGTGKVLYIAGLVDAAKQTRTYDGADIQSQVKATVESLLTALAYGTAGRFEIEQRVGGDPSSNTGVDYGARISASEKSLVETVGGKPDVYAQQLADAPRVSGDASAASKFEALGDTTGKITAPTLTMHTEADPLVLVQNEGVLAQRAVRSGRAGKLVQLYVKAPAKYSETDGAPYGAGHCVFSVDQRVALIDTLDAWVRGVYPVPAGITGAFGAGLDPTYTPGAWPAAAAS